MAVAPNAGEAVGAVLNGQWKLLRLIGEGGLAAVYEAESLKGEGRRAVKLLHRHFLSQQVIVERFHAEAEACFSLRHPHIANVEAYNYAEDGSPYILMELLRGQSLEELLRSKKPVPEEQAAPILDGILQALSVAHARGIVHRDLKPANLFLVPAEGGRYLVKVLDFGIAKVMDVAGGIGSKTRTGAVLGTPGYMSPEQVKNAKAVDPRSDLWSAGVVFYEMLTCKHPYGDTDQLARMVAVLRDAYTPIASVAPQLAKWEPFFQRSLDRDPDKRFQSAQEMAEKLRELSQGGPAKFVADGIQTVAMPMMRAAGGTTQVPASQMVSVASPQHGQGPATRTGTAQMGAVPPPSAAVPLVSQRAPHTPVPSSPPVPMAPPAGAFPGGSTQVSEARPIGTPTLHSDIPPVNIVDAREPEAPSLVWWGVVLVGSTCFALGVILGYLLAG